MAGTQSNFILAKDIICAPVMAETITHKPGEIIQGTARRLMTEVRTVYYFPTIEYPANGTFVAPGKILNAHVRISVVKYFVF